ncbi:MAG: alpha/beta fold hydrolase [Lachnospiraceae bacterium]
MATNLKQVKRGYANLKRSGTQMYYETMGSGDPVIFVHQCWWNNFEFEGVIPMVAKQYTVYSPDSLGFGFSPAAPNWFEFTDFTDSFIDFMDDLGIEKASFVGQHSGSLIMADLAARYPERVDKLIFGGLAIYEDSLRKAKAARRDMIGGNKMPYTKSLRPGDLIGLESGLLQRKEDGSHFVEYWNEQYRENPDSKFEYIQRAAIANLLHYDKGGRDMINALLTFDLERVLPKVKQPSLQLVGDRDCVKPPLFKTIKEAADQLGSEINKIKIVEGGGIMLYLDYPFECAEAILSFPADPAAYKGTAEGPRTRTR